MDVHDEGDFDVLFMKFNRKGRFVCVPSKYTFVSDQFIYYTSDKHSDWVIFGWDHFFKFNKDIFKAYAGNTETNSEPTDDTKSQLNLNTTTTTVDF